MFLRVTFTEIKLREGVGRVKKYWGMLLLTVVLLTVSTPGWGQSQHWAWRGDIRKAAEQDGIVYSLFADKTKMVEDCVPGAGSLCFGDLVHLVISGQNLLEVQQGTLKRDGAAYRSRISTISPWILLASWTSDLSFSSGPREAR